jgi:hypothetical protein
MNRLIVKYGYPITAVILVVFAWVVYSRASRGWDEVATLVVTAAVVWAVVTPAFIYLWPRITVGGFKRAILQRGLGDGPIPVNTLYAAPLSPTATASRGSLLATGTDDVLYLAGWLDLKAGPLVLHVPELDGRYYSLQFTDPATSADFAYVGTRTTGTGAGDFVLSGPRWDEAVPDDVTPIAAPGDEVLVIGRVFVESEADRSTAFALAQQMRLAPLSGQSAS